MTKSECLRLIRQKHPQAILEEHRDAPTKEQRQAMRDKLQANRERKKDIDCLIKELHWNSEAFIQAARFVVDVHGDEPSLTQLAEQLERAERYAELKEEKQQLERFGMKESGVLYIFRCRTYVVHNGPFPHRNIIAEADTWQELADKLCGPELTNASARSGTNPAEAPRIQP